MFGRGGGPPRGAGGAQVFLKTFKVYSPAFIGKPEINRGNKSKSRSLYLFLIVILPSSALEELTHLMVTFPMTFMISNP